MPRYSAFPKSNGQVVSLGSLEKRAATAVSNAALRDLIQDMARALDEMGPKIDRILTILEATVD